MDENAEVIGRLITIAQMPLRTKVTSTRRSAITMRRSASSDITPTRTAKRASSKERSVILPKRSAPTQITPLPITIADSPTQNAETSIRPTLTLRQRSGSRQGSRGEMRCAPERTSLYEIKDTTMCGARHVQRVLILRGNVISRKQSTPYFQQ